MVHAANKRGKGKFFDIRDNLLFSVGFVGYD